MQKNNFLFFKGGTKGAKNSKVYVKRYVFEFFLFKGGMKSAKNSKVYVKRYVFKFFYHNINILILICINILIYKKIYNILHIL